LLRRKWFRAVLRHQPHAATGVKRRRGRGTLTLVSGARDGGLADRRTVRSLKVTKIASRNHQSDLAPMLTISPLTAAGVVLATAATDAVYVMFTSAVVARRRVPAATWSSVWYLLSSFAVISYTENWAYVIFATVTFLHRPPGGPPLGAAPE
jgi:hypothetical protein